MENQKTGIQTNIGTWEDAEKLDKMNSKFFAPESNMKYKVTFSKEPMEDNEAFDGKCISGRLVKKQLPIWANGRKTDKTEEKFVLQLVVDSIDGVPCRSRKIWNVKNKKMRMMFKPYVENNMLFDKIYAITIAGELVRQEYSIAALDKPKSE